MSETRIGRAKVRSRHGLSRDGRQARSARSGHADAHALLVPPAPELGELESLVEVDHLVEPTTDDLLVLERQESPFATVTPIRDVDDFVAEVAVEVERDLVDDVEADTVSVIPAPARPFLSFLLPVSATLGFGAAVAVGTPVLVALLVTVVWLLVALQLAPARMLPGTHPWAGLVPASTAAVAAAGLTVGMVGAPRAAVGASVVLALTGSLAAVALRLLRRIPRRRIVVVGGGADVAASAARWLGHAHVQVVGAVVTDAEGELEPGIVESLGVPVLHEVDGLDDLAQEVAADLVVVSSRVDEGTLRRATWLVEHRRVGVAVLSSLDSVSPHRLNVTAFAGATMTHVASSAPTRLRRILKSGVDRFAGLLLLVAFSPLLALLAVLIRLDSTGGVFFKQVRVGHRGRLFTMWKLRTMRADAEEIKAALLEVDEGAGLLFKMANDPRVTRVGRVLRKLSLDELPQLINVVNGDMSLVGPRPALPQEVAAYDDTTRRRLAAKPGMTGLWQISGRSDLSWDESVRLDLQYTDNWRVRDDAVILMRTAGAVLGSRGAY